MNADGLIAHYERIADSPGSISRLRRFVVDLAMRGKLVPQNPADEPAAALASRMRKEKARQLRSGRRAMAVPLDPALITHSIPGSWVWVALGDVFIYDAGAKREPSQLDPERWLLELEDVEKETSRLLQRLKVRDRESLSTKAEFLPGDILYGKLRPYLNKVVSADAPGYCTTEIVAIRPPIPLDTAFCCLALRRSDFVAYVERLGRGTKMPRLRTPDALAAPFPLAPLQEQHRIVAKVDELMSLCDRLEAARAQREATRDRLMSASVAGLNALGDRSRELATVALSSLPRLSTRRDQIKPLRQMILNLAFRGNLVCQDTNEEPASELLKRVSDDVAAYSNANGIPKSDLSSIKHTDSPRSLPRGWEWTRLGALFRVITDGDHQPPPKANEGVAFLTIGNVTTGRLDFAGCRLVPRDYFRSLASYRTPSKGDILYTVVGATYGRPALVETERDFCVQRHIAILKPAPEMDLRFLVLLLASPLIYEQASLSTTGTAQPTIGLRPLRNFLAPVPPLAEQHRIIAKADELMVLCDRLESSLATAEAARFRLLEALLHDALNGTAFAEAA